VDDENEIPTSWSACMILTAGMTDLMQIRSTLMSSSSRLETASQALIHRSERRRTSPEASAGKKVFGIYSGRKNQFSLGEALEKEYTCMRVVAIIAMTNAKSMGRLPSSRAAKSAIKLGLCMNGMIAYTLKK